LHDLCAGCRLPLAPLPPALLLAIRQLTLFTKNLSKSTLAHETVAAAVLHKHHPIIRVGAEFIQFVYGSHTRWATGVTSSKIPFPPSFGASFHHVPHKVRRGNLLKSMYALRLPLPTFQHPALQFSPRVFSTLPQAFPYFVATLCRI